MPAKQKRLNDTEFEQILAVADAENAKQQAEKQKKQQEREIAKAQARAAVALEVSAPLLMGLTEMEWNQLVACWNSQIKHGFMVNNPVPVIEELVKIFKLICKNPINLSFTHTYVELVCGFTIIFGRIYHSSVGNNAICANEDSVPDYTGIYQTHIKPIDIALQKLHSACLDIICPGKLEGVLQGLDGYKVFFDRRGLELSVLPFRLGNIMQLHENPAGQYAIVNNLSRCILTDESGIAQESGVFVMKILRNSALPNKEPQLEYTWKIYNGGDALVPWSIQSRGSLVQENELPKEALKLLDSYLGEQSTTLIPFPPKQERATLLLEFIKPLVECLSDDTKTVEEKTEAIEVLSEITGLPEDTKAEQWKEWYLHFAEKVKVEQEESTRRVADGDYYTSKLVSPKHKNHPTKAAAAVTSSVTNVSDSTPSFSKVTQITKHATLMRMISVMLKNSGATPKQHMHGDHLVAQGPHGTVTMKKRKEYCPNLARQILKDWYKAFIGSRPTSRLAI
jgi:hypothetical protein